MSDTTFNAAFCLVRAEDTETFTWALSKLKNMLQMHHIRDPEVIISDFDKAFKRGCRAVFITIMPSFKFTMDQPTITYQSGAASPIG